MVSTHSIPAIGEGCGEGDGSSTDGSAGCRGLDQTGASHTDWAGEDVDFGVATAFKKSTAQLTSRALPIDLSLPPVGAIPGGTPTDIGASQGLRSRTSRRL